MKKKIGIIVSIVFIVFLAGLYLIYNNQTKIILKQDTFVFEYGDDILSDVSYYLKDANSTKNIDKYKLSSDSLIISNDKLLLPEKEIVDIGEYNLNIKYKKKVVDFKIKVLDSKAPIFIESKEVINVDENTKDIDFMQYFKVEDLSEVKLTIQGDYDLTKAGGYKLKVIAKDSSDNSSEIEFTLKVEEVKKEEIISPKPSNQKPASNNNNNNKGNYNQSVQTPTPSAPKYRKDISNLYVNQINEYRKSKGLASLSVTSEAQTEADRRSKELVAYYSHDGAGYGFGEIIGKGDVGVDFVTAWKNSPSHNATMLREQNTAIAASVYEYENYWYAVVSFRMDY